VRREIKAREVNACAESRDPSFFTTDTIAHIAKVANGARSEGAFASVKASSTWVLTEVGFPVQTAISQRSSFRNHLEVFNSVLRSFEMMANRMSVSPSIFTAFMSPNMLKVTSNLFCTRSIHCFWACPVRVDNGIIANTRTVKKLAFSDRGEGHQQYLCK
jgi:hypothetical protein